MTQKKNTKSKRRLKRNVRKTMGTLCLVSSLIVASIPVNGSREAAASVTTENGETIYSSDLTWEKVNKESSSIPVITNQSEPIYTTEDGLFMFAFIQKSNNSPTKVAMLLGYSGGTLTNNTLTVPDTVSAYAKYTDNNGSSEGYVAVSQSGKPLFYLATQPEKVTDASGNDVAATYSLPVLKPCYASDSTWKSLSLDQFYFIDDGATDNVTINSDSTTTTTPDDQIRDGVVTDKYGVKYQITGNTSDNQWITNIDVVYIGNQYLTDRTDDSATASGLKLEWKVASPVINTDPEKGVFAGYANIQTLNIGSKLEGIGNYAFYGCTGLSTVSFGNGLTEIGTKAFMNCIRMSTIGLDESSNISYIPDYCFAGCTSLTTFTMPYNVSAIYDHAFDGCTALKTMTLEGTGSTALNQIGYSVFKNCSALEELIIPTNFGGTNPINVNNFEGCKSLKHIQALNSAMQFEGPTVSSNDALYTSYTIDEFKSTVASTFYFEGADASKTHDFTKANEIAFKYAGQDLYEIITTEGSAQLTYQVNSANELKYFNMTGSASEVTIPAKIGPYGISAIDSGSFSGNCLLTKITIPATVTAINEEAFKGCHNLKAVIFKDASAITTIGTDAFATQVVSYHQDDCSKTLDSSPSLSFTGEVGEDIVPFTYAMTSTSNINTGTQPLTYITYYSGWPTNLTIQYVTSNDNTAQDKSGKATLVDYPTYNELSTFVNYSETVKTYPYMTEAYAAAAKQALNDYDNYKDGKLTTQMTQDEWDIINAALNPVIPSGVEAIKEGLFNGADSVSSVSDGDAYTVNRTTGGKADTYLQTITFEDLDEYTPYMFDGCTSLTSITIDGGTAEIDNYAFAQTDASNSALTTFYMATDSGSTIGDYAFDNNPELSNVTISSSVSSLGIRPFRGCTSLKSGNLSFSGSPYFEESDSVIYGLTNGVRTSIVECLESKAGSLTIDGSSITSMSEEAFMDTNVSKVDLSGTSLTKLPERAFDNTEDLFSVTLPSTMQTISNEAFHDSNIRLLEDIPDSLALIQPSAFDTPEDYQSSEGKYNEIEFECTESAIVARAYADEHENINAVTIPSTQYWSVRFISQDENGDTYDFYDEQTVLDGESARTPELTPALDGYTFTGWYTTPGGVSIDDYDMTSIHEDLIFQARFVTAGEETTTVRFIDTDTGEEVASRQTVTVGSYAVEPVSPTKDGYTFNGWYPDITTAIPAVTSGSYYDFYAKWTANSSSSDDDDSNNSSTDNSGSNSDSNSGNNTSNTTSTTLYTLTVKNGMGSGSYAEGAQAIIIANDPASGQEFSYWSVDSGDVTLPSTAVSATVVTMPAENVTVTAHYMVSTSTGTSSGSGSNVSGNSGTTRNAGTVSNNGTTVVIDKNGLSNTGVVSATVNGSSDNFTVKVSESSSATEAAVKALMAEFGTDLTNIKYFPMDISLYDSTGKTEITDTSGLSVTITLPLPDSMIAYAGNNKVASVVNDKLEKLGAKFTTIDGVACISFTAEHFSPYVIYADTANLTASTISDSTPKTGDGIHPKWFLSFGLACISVVLFLKKDKRQVPQKVRA